MGPGQICTWHKCKQTKYEILIRFIVRENQEMTFVQKHVTIQKYSFSPHFLTKNCIEGITFAEDLHQFLCVELALRVVHIQFNDIVPCNSTFEAQEDVGVLLLNAIAGYLASDFWKLLVCHLRKTKNEVVLWSFQPANTWWVTRLS